MYWNQNRKNYEPAFDKKPKRGRIFWVRPNPYRDTGEHVQRAGRPAIIVSNEEINRGNWSYEIVYLTTSPKRDSPTNCTIRSANKVSTALCGQVQTISSEQLGEYIGECTIQEMEAVDRCMMISLALDIPETPDTMVAGEESNPDQATVDRLRQENEQFKAKLTMAAEHLKIMQNAYNELLGKTLQFDNT